MTQIELYYYLKLLGRTKDHLTHSKVGGRLKDKLSRRNKRLSACESNIY